MSLLDSAFEAFAIMDKITQPDGVGGVETIWTIGAEIEAAASLDTSTEARIAYAAGTKAMYTITTRKNVNLWYHDVIKRLSDGKIFRITSDGTDKKTPASAALNMRQVTAEEWKI